MHKLINLRARAKQLGLYINKHNNRYSIGINNDYDVDNSTFCCNTKNEVDSFLCGVAYQLYYAPKAQSTGNTSTQSTDSTQ